MFTLQFTHDYSIAVFRRTRITDSKNINPTRIIKVVNRASRTNRHWGEVKNLMEFFRKKYGRRWCEFWKTDESKAKYNNIEQRYY